MTHAPARVLSCPNCGGPLSALDAGGATTCAYCNATSIVGARPELVTSGIVLPDPASPAERARLEKLRASAATFDSDKDRFSLDFAPKGYDDIDGFDSTRETAQRLEKDFRAALADPDSVPERTTWWLAERLVNLWKMRKDHVRAGAIAQTASEALSDKRLKQTMFTALAGQARREGDFDAAETWLAQCDAQTTELALDGDFRNGFALLALARGQAKLALRAVGDLATTFPWAPQAAPMGALIRTAAHELAGATATAEEDLREIIEAIAQKTIRSNSHLDPDDIREQCRTIARNWVANTLADSPPLKPALGVWERLAANDELPKHADAVAAFRKQYA